MAAPVFNTLDDSPTYTENGPTVRLDDDATISDADLGPADPFTGATLTLARAGGANVDDIFGGSGTLSFTDGQVLLRESVFNPDTGSFEPTDIPVGSFANEGGTLVIVFNEQATGARVNAVLEQITYGNTSDAPPPSVLINYTFDNGEVATGSITVTITATNDAPTLDSVAPAATYQPGTPGAPLSPSVNVADVDGTTIASAEVRIIGVVAGDVLSADVGATGITANYDSGTGILTLSNVATHAAYEQVLATVTYSSSNPDPASGGTTRFIQWRVNDGGAASAAQPTTISFTPTVDLDQSAAGNDFAATFTENGAAVAIADSDVIVVGGSGGVASATVVLTNAKPSDSLAIAGALPSGIDGSIDTSVTGRITVTLTGAASPADYQTALQQILFSNPSDAPDTAPRNVTVVLTDGERASNAAQATVGIVPSNDPGSVNDDTASTVENRTLIRAAAQGVLANDSDPDGPLTVITGDVATSQGGLIHFHGDGSYEYQPLAGFSGTDTVSYTARDPLGNDASAMLTVEVVPRALDNDFNADGRADILWRHNNGTSNIFLMDGATVIGGSNLSQQVDTNWQAQDKNDFNGDGHADILWRHQNGTSNVFLMDGATVIGGSNLSQQVDNNWSVQDTGDFNGDGKADILWRHANGTANVFLMDGATVIGGSNLSQQLDSNWSVQDTGDFNGDGHADILWRHANGTASVFLMDGATVIGGSNLSQQVDNNWTVQAVDDFNGDGRADILWRHQNGTSNIFLMDGATVIGGSNLSQQVDNNWTVQDTGDYNGDGRADILWRHANGTSNIFLMDGATVLGGSNLSLQIDNNWHVI
jgi:Big-like domain-containing protein/VCBS repeat protein